jgi:hypothetical protein
VPAVKSATVVSTNASGSGVMKVAVAGGTGDVAVAPDRLVEVTRK